jgi:O-acetyl-ADP-ribose deacetylase (regulator of RNase III)
MANYIEVDGDATKPQRLNPNEIVVIPHVCNNSGGWGRGFVLALNKAFGLGPMNEYKKMEQESPNGLKNRMGEVCICPVGNDVYVANMIAQNGFKSATNPKPLQYWALLKCMQEVCISVVSHSALNTDKSSLPSIVIHCPKFGSDLAGGNWDLIKELIMEVWVDRGIDVVVYNYVP